MILKFSQDLLILCWFAFIPMVEQFLVFCFWLEFFSKLIVCFDQFFNLLFTFYVLLFNLADFYFENVSLLLSDLIFEPLYLYFELIILYIQLIFLIFERLNDGVVTNILLS